MDLNELCSEATECLEFGGLIVLLIVTFPIWLPIWIVFKIVQGVRGY